VAEHYGIALPGWKRWPGPHTPRYVEFAPCWWSRERALRPDSFKSWSPSDGRENEERILMVLCNRGPPLRKIPPIQSPRPPHVANPGTRTLIDAKPPLRPKHVWSIRSLPKCRWFRALMIWIFRGRAEASGLPSSVSKTVSRRNSDHLAHHPHWGVL